MILRQIGGTGHYKIVGASLLKGVMRKEALNKPGIVERVTLE